jgi:phage terminase large subunit-like protein
LLLNTAAQDGKGVRIGFGQDPGQAGKSQALHLVRALEAGALRSITEVPPFEMARELVRKVQAD